jgi:molybdopterin-guanine dinucleotide biosynthesis protein A
MFSFWSIKSFDYLESILQKNDGYKIMKFAQEIGFEYLNFEKKSKADFFNVNSPEDYESLLRLV